MIDANLYLQIHLVNTASAPISAYLLGMAEVFSYLVKASVIVSTYLLSISENLQGQTDPCEWIDWIACIVAFVVVA
jgi:hypothetical protein